MDLTVLVLWKKQEARRVVGSVSERVRDEAGCVYMLGHLTTQAGSVQPDSLGIKSFKVFKKTVIVSDMAVTCRKYCPPRENSKKRSKKGIASILKLLCVIFFLLFY